MRRIIQTSKRAYFRGNDRAERVKDAFRAHEWIEAKIEVALVGTLGTDTYNVIRDALLSGQYRAAQLMAWEHEATLRISVTGAYGYVLSERAAIRESKQRYEGILSELGESLAEYNERSGYNFRSEARAERQMWLDDSTSSSTSYPGLDVHDTVYRTRRETRPGAEYPGQRIVSRTRGEERVLVTTGCGCVHDELRASFPELAPIIALHLADTRAGAPDQEAAIASYLATIPAREWQHRDHAARETHLVSLGLLESQSDELIYIKGIGSCPARGYRYGSGWCEHLISDDAMRALHLFIEAEQAHDAKEAA